MARMATQFYTVSLFAFATSLSFAADHWGTASLDDASAGVIGKDVRELSSDIVKFEQGLDGRKGVILGEVLEGGFFHAAGGSKYDIVVALNGWRIDSVPDLYAASQRMKPGKTATAIILRATTSNDVLEYSASPVQIAAVVPTRREAMLARLIEVEDPTSGAKWIQHVRAPKDRTAQTQLKLLFQMQNGKAKNLQILLSIVAEKLIIPNAIEFRTGERSSLFPVKFADVDVQISTAASSACIQWPATPKLIAAFTEIARVGQGQLRIQPRDGEEIVIDIPREAALQFSDVLAGYKLRGGDLSDSQMQWFIDQIKAGDEQLARLSSPVKLQKYSETAASNRSSPR